MTIGELKKELEKYDDNLEIIHDDTDYRLCEVQGTSLQEHDYREFGTTYIIKAPFVWMH